MKLKNKKTGEIVELFGITCINGRTFVQFDDGKGTFKFEARSLAKLNEMFEDYEEPKDYWWISPVDTDVTHCVEDAKDEMDQYNKEIGNYFDTREEAEKAVEKLKAWKRLKDKGFKFIGVRGLGKVIDFDIPEPYNHVCYDEYNATKDEKEFYDDLLFLFGGE